LAKTEDPSSTTTSKFDCSAHEGLPTGVIVQAAFQATAADHPVSEVPFPPERELNPDTVVQEVLARNPTLAQMTAAWQAASARYPQVTSLDDPMFRFAMAPGSIGSNNVEFGYSVEISQKYPFPGKLEMRGRNAAAEASAAGHDVDDMRLQLIESARNAFYDYYLVHRAQAVNDENLTLLKKARKSAENRVSANKAPPQEVYQLDVEIGKQQERVVTLGRMRKVAIARLNTLMHLPPEAPLPPPPAQIGLAGALPPVEFLRSQAEQRPDVRALTDRVTAEESSLALAEREFYPDFEVGARYDTIMGNGPTRDLAGQLTVGINLPVRCSRRQGAVAEAHARIAERRAELAHLSDQVHYQVQEAYEQTAESEKLVRLYEKTILPDADKNVTAAENAYTAGQIPLLSYLEAQRNKVGLYDRYYQALAEYHQHRAALERAVGARLSASQP
jgi:outer membrane protein TolC